MIVISEINNTLAIADASYLELIKQYINQSRLGNNVIGIFTKLNIIKVCRHSLKTLNLVTPQVTEVQFEHIKDLVYSINGWLFSLGYITSLSAPALPTSVTGCVSTGSVDWLYHSFQAGSNNQTTFTGLPFNIDNVDPEAIRFIINGETMIYGLNADYHIIGSTLYWHNNLLNIDTQDKLTLAYYIL